MTFGIVETSQDGGRPVELLKVSYLTNNWCYTTSDDTIIHDGNTYLPLPISHSAIKPSDDVAKASITVRVPEDCPIGELFRIQPPSGVVTLTLFQMHIGDNDAKAIWKGRITNAEWDDERLLSLTVDNLFSSLQRVGARRKFAVQCPLALYGQGLGECNVNRELHKQTHLVTSITGSTVKCDSAAALPAGFFAGGYVTWNSPLGYLEKRMVTSSDADGNLVLTSPPRGMTVGQTVSIYPGCDHSKATCDSKFGNSLNYGGQLFIPQKNPFNGSTLY